MARPSPRWTGTAWQVDLRKPWNLGRHLLPGIPRDCAAEAVHAAYELLARLESARPSTSQLSLPIAEGPTVATAIRQWAEHRKYKRSRKWCDGAVARVVAELGHLRVAELAPPRGTDLLFAWRDRLRAEGYERRSGETVRRVRVGPHAMCDRLQVLRMFLAWASEPARKMLPYLPTFPDPRVDETEAMVRKLTAWTDEATFRAVRDSIYKGNMGTANLVASWKRDGLPWPGCTLDDYIARRRLWLSFAFYTGMRETDLNAIDDLSVSTLAWCYWRWGRKTSTEEGLPEDMPPPLLADIEAELRRRGIAAFPPGDLICGGLWRRPTRPLGAACRAVGVPVFDVMTMRRSFCYHKAAAGVLEEDLVRLMGHADSQMIHTVYLQVPPASKRNAAGRAWPAMRASEPGLGQARVVPISAVRRMRAAGTEAAKVPTSVEAPCEGARHVASAKSKPKEHQGT